MNLIPFAGTVIASLLAFSYWIESREKRVEKVKPNSSENHHLSLTKIQSGLGNLYRYTPTFLFLSLAILQFHIYGELTKEIRSFPLFYGIHIPCLFLIGPLGYIFFEELSGGRSEKIQWYHLLPSIISFFYLYLFRPDSFQISFLDSQFHEPTSFYYSSIGVLLGFGVVSIFGYTLTILVRILRWKLEFKETIESSFLPFLYFMGYSLLVVSLFVFSQLFYMQIFLFACATLTFLLAYIFVLKAVHKEFIPNFKKETRLARYQESRVKGVDITLVLQQLEELMGLEKLYLNEDLSLSFLSKRLGLNTHQVSEILNSKLGCTFRNYVNGYRLQEAAKLLLERKEMTILSVIYASGFNSKSSFHKLFQNRFGISPQNYRSLSK